MRENETSLLIRLPLLGWGESRGGLTTAQNFEIVIYQIGDSKGDMKRERIFDYVRVTGRAEMRDAEFVRRCGVSQAPAREAMHRRRHRERSSAVQDDLIEARVILETAAMSEVARLATDEALQALGVTGGEGGRDWCDTRSSKP